MKFTVVWMASAQRELARLWTDQADRAAITAAANAIDVRLSRDPERLGESREDEMRVLIAAPLTVFFRVRVDDRMVEVVSVKYIARRD